MRFRRISEISEKRKINVLVTIRQIMHLHSFEKITHGFLAREDGRNDDEGLSVLGRAGSSVHLGRQIRLEKERQVEVQNAHGEVAGWHGQQQSDGKQCRRSCAQNERVQEKRDENKRGQYSDRTEVCSRRVSKNKPEQSLAQLRAIANLLF